MQRALLELGLRDGALQKIGGTGIQRRDATFAILMGGDDDGGHFAACRHGADAANEFGARHFRHAIVHDQQVSLLLIEKLERTHGILEAVNLIAIAHQFDELCINAQIRRTIIDYDNACLHDMRR